MSFLAPVFLLGALAVAAPIIFHLIRRTTKEVTPFSTLMFLQPTPPRVTRRSRLENLWLLLLRCAVLGLLALGFAGIADAKAQWRFLGGGRGVVSFGSPVQARVLQLLRGHGCERHGDLARPREPLQPVEPRTVLHVTEHHDLAQLRSVVRGLIEQLTGADERGVEMRGAPAG